MKAVVFSGTTEGRQFSKILANLGVEVLVSVATEIGAEEQDENENITIHVGRCTAAEMTKLLHGASICVDATHPYATEATRTICEACETTGVEYHRLLRTESDCRRTVSCLERQQKRQNISKVLPGMSCSRPVQRSCLLLKI